MSEDSLLSLCHIWVFNNYPELRYCTWHIANERKQSKVQGAIMKSKGVVSGVPDYAINYDGKTLYIEFKSDIGVLSESQKKVHLALKKQGFTVVVIRTFEEFKIFINEIFKNQISRNS